MDRTYWAWAEETFDLTPSGSTRGTMSRLLIKQVADFGYGGLVKAVSGLP